MLSRVHLTSAVLLLLLSAAVASAAPIQLGSGNVTYHLDDAQAGFTSFSASVNNGIDFNPSVSEFVTAGNTAFANLDFEVYGNDAGGGNVFAFDDFDFMLSGVVVPVTGAASITLSGSLDVIGASQGGVDIGNPGLAVNNIISTQPSVVGPWNDTLSWNIFTDFLSGTAFETAVATGLDFSLVVSITAIGGASITQITDGMSDVGVSVQPGVAVPEPGTGLLLGLGLAAVSRARCVRRG